MQDCATPPMCFQTPASLPLEAAFDGGRITSDGGVCWLAKADRELGVCEALAGEVPEWRGRSARHPLLCLVRQRVYQIACGYEDQNDADALRSDPLLKLVLGRLPQTGEDLASQPTLSRLENAPGAKDCLRIARALGEVYVRERAKDGQPPRVLLDLDSTDDPTHGEQEGAYYHGYYRQHMYHPLLVFDGHTGRLVTAVLRAGNTHAGHGTVAVLKRVVGRVREAWPGVEVEIRADAGFAVPAVYEWCEKEGVIYTVGLVTNPPGSRRSPSPSSGGRKSVTRPKGGRPGCFPKAPTGLAVGSVLGGWSTRRRRWRRGPTGASWLPTREARLPESFTTGT